MGFLFVMDAAVAVLKRVTLRYLSMFWRKLGMNMGLQNMSNSQFQRAWAHAVCTMSHYWEPTMTELGWVNWSLKKTISPLLNGRLELPKKVIQPLFQNILNNIDLSLFETFCSCIQIWIVYKWTLCICGWIQKYARIWLTANPCEYKNYTQGHYGEWK